MGLLTVWRTRRIFFCRNCAGKKMRVYQDLAIVKDALL